MASKKASLSPNPGAEPISPVSDTPAYHAWWAHKTPQERLLQYLEGYPAILKGMQLLAKGSRLIPELDIRKHEPQEYVDSLCAEGYAWVPTGFMPLPPISPRIEEPNSNLGVYDPLSPPPGAWIIGKVVKGPNFSTDQFDYTVTPIDVASSLVPNLDSNLYAGGPGNPVPGLEDTGIRFPLSYVGHPDTFPFGKLFGFKLGIFVKVDHSSQALWHNADNYPGAAMLEVG